MRMIDWSSYVGSSDLPLRDLRVAAARDDVNSRREQMLADEIIQTTIALGLDKLQARGRPRAQVAAWAHAYLLEDEASETAPAPFRDAMKRNIARLEVASLDIADRAGGGAAGQPTRSEEHTSELKSLMRI